MMSSGEHPGLYVHVPFCRSKCPYCDFYSVTSTSLIASWLNAVVKEAVLYKESFSTFDSLYMGGGTPSLLDGRHLTALVNSLRRHFTFVPHTEITIEANPGDICQDKLALFQDLGINRVSLGVQSFYDAELRFLGRRHTAREAERAIDLIRDAGFRNLGLDLMYGFQGQSETDWAATLEMALQFSPEHLSCYQLTLEDGTPFGKKKREGRICLLGEEQESALFTMTSDFLVEHGYTHYEISNFSRGHDHRSRHNQKYWRHVPYLGLGPSAHSFLGRVRWWNVQSVETYVAVLDGGRKPFKGKENLTEEQLELESLYLGLRTVDGVSVETIRKQPGVEGALDELRESGLVKVDHGRIIPTQRGFLVADSLPLLLSL